MRNNIQRSEIGRPNPFDILDEDKGSIQEPYNLEDPIEETVVDPVEELEPIEDTPIEDTPLEVEDTPEEEEEEFIEDEDAKVQIKTNIPKLLGKRLKDDGQLPADFEITEETTTQDIEEAYRGYMSEKFKEESDSIAYDSLREQYGDDSVLETAKRLHYGVTEQEIQIKQVYQALGSLDINDSEENYEQLTKTLYKQYYLDKNLSVAEADANTERDFEDGDIDSLTESRKSYFSQKAIEVDQNQKEAVKEAKRIEKEKGDASVANINKMLDTLTLDDVSYTKKEMDVVKKALFVKSEVIVVNNKRVPVTPYHKKKYERSLSEEKSLKDIADFILGYDSKSISKAARKVSKKKMVDELNDLIEVDVVVPGRGIRKKTEDTPSGGIQRKAL